MKRETQYNVRISDEDRSLISSFFERLDNQIQKFKNTENLKTAISKAKTSISGYYFVPNREGALKIVMDLRSELQDLPHRKDNRSVRDILKRDPKPEDMDPFIKFLEEGIIPKLNFLGMEEGNKKKQEEMAERNNQRKEHCFHEIKLKLEAFKRFDSNIDSHGTLNKFIQWETDTEKQLKSLVQEEVEIVDARDILMQEEEYLDHRLQALKSNNAASQAKSILSKALEEIKQSLEKFRNELITLQKEKDTLGQKLTTRKPVYTDLKAAQRNLKNEIDSLWECYCSKEDQKDSVFSKLKFIIKAEQNKNDRIELLERAAPILDGSYSVAIIQHHPAPSAPPPDFALAFKSLQIGDNNQPSASIKPEEEYDLR